MPWTSIDKKVQQILIFTKILQNAKVFFLSCSQGIEISVERKCTAGLKRNGSDSWYAWSGCPC